MWFVVHKGRSWTELYSTPAAPLSEEELPKGPTEMVGSAAIISARMSSTG